MKPKVSVIVPVYKVEQYLERCVRSILTQTYGDFELILVDDGSPDRCGVMCDTFAGEDRRVRVLHKKNGGLSDARNVGIAQAKGEYILLVDSDDFIAANAMERLVSLAQEDGADMVCGNICNCYKESSVRQYPEDLLLRCTGAEALGLALEGKKVTGSSCGKLMTAQLCKAHIFPLGRAYEDAFFLADILPDAEKVTVTTEPLYQYWHRSGSVTTRPFTRQDMDVIAAYRYTLDTVTRRCPQLVPQAQFRLHWAHFVVMDRMMELSHYYKQAGYPQAKAYLKKNWISIARCPFFNKGRRLAAVVLKVNIKLYYLLSALNRKKTEVHVS